MAAKPEPCVTYLNLDSLNHPPMMMIKNENQYLSLEEQYPHYLSRARCYTKETRLNKSSNSLVMRRPRRSRTVFTRDQVAELKYYFMQCSYVNTERAEQLANKLSMPIGPVRIWFKNQRRKMKIKLSEMQKRIPEETDIELPQNRRHTLHYLPTLTQPTPVPTPSPSISDIDMKFSYDPVYLDSSAYNSKQNTAYKVNEKANQWLQHLPIIKSSQMVYNSASPRHVPIHSFHDSLINFNRLPYTLPSPASTTSETGNSMTVNSDTSDYFSQMSPESEIIEPLTPKSVHGEAESVFSGILDSLKTPQTVPPIQTVYEKLTSDPDPKIKHEFDAVLEPHQQLPSSDQSLCLQFD